MPVSARINSFIKTVYPWLAIFMIAMCWDFASYYSNKTIPQAALLLILKDWCETVSTFGTVMAVQYIATRIESGIYTRLWLSGKGLIHITIDLLTRTLLFNIALAFFFLIIEVFVISSLQTNIPLEMWFSAIVLSGYVRTFAMSTFFVWKMIPILNLVPSRYAIAFFILVTLLHMPLEAFIPKVVGEDLGMKVIRYIPDSVASRLLDSFTEYNEYIPLLSYLLIFLVLTFLTSRYTIRLKSD